MHAMIVLMPTHLISLPALHSLQMSCGDVSNKFSKYLHFPSIPCTQLYKSREVSNTRYKIKLHSINHPEPAPPCHTLLIFNFHFTLYCTTNILHLHLQLGLFRCKTPRLVLEVE